MNNRVVSVLLCATAVAFVCAPASGQRARRAPARKPAPSVADLSGESARAWPASTMFYAELSDAASVADQLGGVELFHRLLRESFASVPSNAGRRFPLSVDQFRQVMESRLAFGLLLPQDAQLTMLPNVDPIIACMIQSPTADVADLTKQMIDEAGRRNGTPGAPAVTSVAGASMRTWGTGRSASAVTRVGNDFAFGDPNGVAMVLETTAHARAPRLAELPAFKAANARVPGRRQFFAFLNGAPVAAAFNAGIDQSYSRSAPAGKAAPAPEASALKRFIGMDALVGGSVSALADAGQVTLQAALEFDRTRNGLVSILSDPPIVSGRTAALMPIGTDGVMVTSIDAVRIFDLYLQVVTPDVAKRLGVPAPPEMIRQFETTYEMRLRDDFLAAFGNEVAVCTRLAPSPATMARVQDRGDEGAKAPGPGDVFALVEVRNPAAVGQFIDRTLAGPEGQAGPPPAVFRDVEIWNVGSMSCALVGGYLVFGERSMIEEIVVAYQTEQGLLQNSDYLKALGGMPNNAIGLVYVSPDFIDMAARKGGAPHTKPLYPQGLLFALQKDDSGIYTNIQAPLPDLRNLFETGPGPVALASRQSTRRR